MIQTSAANLKFQDFMRLGRYDEVMPAYVETVHKRGGVDLNRANLGVQMEGTNQLMQVWDEFLSRVEGKGRVMKQSTEHLERDIIRQILTLIAILAAFGVNVLANVAPFNGLTIGEISNTVFRSVLITPANYAFAIWGLIYLGLISFGVYQVLPAQRQNPRLRRMGYLLVVACLAQIAWVFFFQYQLFSLSLVAMLAILLPLIGIYLRLEIGKVRVSRKEMWLVRVPLSIYLAWISVATIVNVATTLYNLGWNGWGISAEVWTIIALVAGGAIASIVTIQRSDPAFVLVIVWAFVAIAVRQANVPLIALTAGGLAIALVLLLLVSVLRQRARINSHE